MASSGYWGPPTASDWCESNYEISYYVAEFFNSLSSISMIVVGLAGIYLHSSFEKRFLLTFGSIAVVGLGSIAFHGTLLFPLQMLDEVPMVYSILSLAYCCIEDRSYRRYGAWFPVSIALYGLLTTLVMLFAGPGNHLLEFVVFQSSFAFCVLFVMSNIIKIYSGIEDRAIKQMWMVTLLIALSSYSLWNVDFRMCDVMQNLPLGLWNPQLHAVWHVGASVTSYLVTLLLCYNRAENLGRKPVMEWKWRMLPFVVVKHDKFYSDYGDNDPIYGDDLADEDRESRPRLMLMGLRRSGKSSIQRVVFHKMSPTETLFLESTSKINKDNIHSFIDFQVWDFPGQMDFFDSTFDTTAIFGEVGALVFVIDSQDDYMEALARLHSTVVAAYRVNPNITFEVFIHKVDGLSEDYKIDTQRDIQQTTTDELADAGLENVQLAFYLTSIYDHSIFEAFSKVIQKLIPQLPTLENLLNILCANSGIEKAFLFDVISKIYIATDSSPVDSQSYEICSDMIDVIIDISSIYGRAAIGAKSQGYLEDQQDDQDNWSQNQGRHDDFEDSNGGNGNGNHQRSGTNENYSQAVVGRGSRTPSLSNQSTQQQTAGNHEAFSVIKMGNGTVLYLREVNKYLALICLLRAETFEKQGLIDYNVHCFKEAMDQVFELKRAERTRREMEANQLLQQQQQQLHKGMYGHG
ncbi:hypothetical protein BGZ99_005573 [Dissophora globulifera]|uniref:Uncharacterized protein n=1 Tax=Dissophora globulifera TaxID=979702 RepID=A0A9P6RH73_9FUNG|nr:hypothetical protein BGZ99_005573 [Dissophora globulifera]